MPQERGWGQEMGFHKVGVTGQGSAVAETEGTGLEQCLGWGGGGGWKRVAPGLTQGMASCSPGKSLWLPGHPDSVLHRLRLHPAPALLCIAPQPAQPGAGRGPSQCWAQAWPRGLMAAWPLEGLM